MNYSAQYHRQHCTLYASEQFEALYSSNHDVKHPARSGFDPGTSRLQAPVDTDEPSGPALFSSTLLRLSSKPIECCCYNVGPLSGHCQAQHHSYIGLVYRVC